MALHDWRSSVKWDYKILPIEQAIITAAKTSSVVKLDYILKGGTYDIIPIIRARDSFAQTQKIIGYNVAVSFSILFDNLGVYVPVLDDNFQGQEVALNLSLSSINAVGVNEWKLIAFNNIRMNFSITKGDNKPIVNFNFSGSVSKAEMQIYFTQWNSSEPV